MDNVLFSVYTGINDDGYVARYEFDRSIAGGRLHPIADLQISGGPYDRLSITDRRAAPTTA